MYMSTHRISRREMLKALGVGITGTALAACMAPAQLQSTQGATSQAAIPSLESAKLSYWGHAYVGREQVAQAVATDYQDENPGAEIQLDSIPLVDFETKIATAFAGGTQPDILSIGDWIIPAYASKNLLAPLDPSAWEKSSAQEIVDLFEPGTMEGLQYQDKLWGYPMEVSVLVPIFRIAHLEELGVDPDSPPDTYEDWVELGLKGVKRDEEGRMVRQWFEWFLHDASLLFQTLGPALLGHGGDFLSTDGMQGTLNTSAGLQALQFFSDTIHEWKLTDPGFKLGADEGHLLVVDKETYAWANLPGTVWFTQTFNLEYNKDVKLQTMWKWRDGERRNVFYSYGFVVTAPSPHQKEAWEYIEYMTRFPERTIQWIDTAGLTQTRKGWNTMEKVRDLPYADFFVEEFKHSVRLPRTPHYNEIAKEFLTQMERLIVSPSASVEEIAVDFDAAVSKITGMA